MATEHDREMTLSDGREVLVDFTVDSYGSDPSGMYGPPEDYDPGSGAELYITKVVLSEGPDAPIPITDDERERLETILLENPDWYTPDGYDDDDYWDYDR